MADNFKLTQPQSGTSFKSKDVGGVHIPGKILYNENGSPADIATAAKQEVQTSALGAIVEALASVISVLQDTLTVATHAVTQGGAWVLSAGSAIIGRVGIDQTAPGTTNAVAPIAGENGVAAGAGTVNATTQRVTLASDDPAVSALGATAGAAVVTDASGTIQQYLRGLVKMIAGKITVGIDQATPGVTNRVDIGAVAGRKYGAVAASQIDHVLGATGATGDDIDGLLIVPATTSPGTVSIKDGTGGAITVFTGGADSVSNLVPFFIPLGLRSLAGAWKVTTGANVSVIAIGNFT